ncbi:MAG: hypothetical protein AAFY84_12680 [Pseudomonadota bacterium]
MTQAASPAARETVFLLGNGPSLAGIDLRAISPFPTLGMNAAYRYWDQIDWCPTYYACLDLTVGLSHKDEIVRLIEEERIEKLLLRDNLIETLGSAARTDRVVNFDALAARSDLLSIPHPTTGSHSALWASHMGFTRIILLGIDLQYKEFVDGAEKRSGIELEITRDSDNPNYFFDGYQRPGDRYNIPNPRPGLHVNAWTAAGQRLSTHGVEVLNGNSSSAIDIFAYVDPARAMAGDFASSPAKRDLPTMPMHEDPASVASSSSKRLRAFLASQGKMIAAAATIILALTALLPLLLGASLVTNVLGAIIGLGLALLLTAGLYVRHAVLAHLFRLTRDTDALKARIRDLERRLGDN